MGLGLDHQFNNFRIKEKRILGLTDGTSHDDDENNLRDIEGQGLVDSKELRNH